MFMPSRDQYLPPDYMSPLPTTVSPSSTIFPSDENPLALYVQLDAKKSPLALLAQTCSQIGADTANNKPIIPPLEKIARAKDDDRYRKTLNGRETDSRSSGDHSKKETRSLSGSSAENASSPKSSPPGKGSEGKLDSGKPRSVSPTKASETRSATPIIRSGLEVLQGFPKEIPLGAYRPGYLPPLPTTTTAASALYSPEGNPFLRTPPLSTSSLLDPNSYLGLTRLKAADMILPLCRDPSCRGCHYGATAHLGPVAVCPAGCAQCTHQKFYSLFPALSSPPPASAYLSSATQQQQQPHVCNWISGGSYCGKRFATSEELLQHLRTHTSLAGDPAATTPYAGAAGPYRSSVSDLRYHPYGKPTSTSSFGIHSPPHVPGFPLLYPSLAAYYAPYSSLYGP